MLTSLNISQIMRVLACLLIRKENFSQSMVARYDAPSQKFPYKPKSYAIISQIYETFRLVVVHISF